MAIRIQRKRTKGWKKPMWAIYVGRPSKWGNPFDWRTLPGGKPEAVEKYKDWLPRAVESGELNPEPLRDKTLMCYCKAEEPCHGDAIIEFLKNTKPKL